MLTQPARRLLSTLCLVAVALLGAAGALVARDMADPLPDADTEPTPFWTPVGTASTDDSQPAVLRLSWSEEVVVTGGSITGRVTDLPSLVAVESGAAAIEVDGRVRPVLLGARPLWRRLEYGAVGPDVSEVSGLLVAGGYLDGDAQSERVDSHFMAGVRSFERDRGWQPTGVFDPAYVLWLPERDWGALVPAVDVGDAIGPEAVLFTVPSIVVDARLGAADTDIPLDLPRAPLTFAVIGGSATVDVGESGSVDDEDLALVTTTAQESAAAGEVPATLNGVVQRREPIDVHTVPTDAIVIGADGSFCVETEGNGVVSVVPTGGRAGVTELQPTLDESARVRVHPSSEIEAECGS